MKNILIIGGSKGIGNALLKMLIGSHKIINISRTLPEITHENLTNYSLDVTEDELPTLDTIDGIVYCPGSINLKPFSRLKLGDFEQDFKINVLSAVKVIQFYLKNLIASESASVVLFSTVASKMGMPYHASIAASKSAVEGLTMSLAAEYATKIRFNAIAPTVTNTTLAEKLLRNDKMIESIKDRHPYKNFLEPEEVAHLAEYLLSEKSTAISGQVFPIDSGIVTVKL
jgi:NAD(P)-dependent dehydrogenase (short-subunit alcohol dehydrogenase family)|tara:strand:+ start:1752 stop:2435 length:684 start_codon:yes stop_codon:yes gene_type:complete